MPAKLRVLRREALIPRPLDEVFPFFSDPRNLQILTPDFLNFRILTELGDQTHEGQVIDYALRLWGLPTRWRTLIARWEPPHRFVDLAVHSPYAFWHHTHEFEAKGGATLMRDTVLYSLPFYPLGDWLASGLVRKNIEAIFDHRERVIAKRFA